MPIPLPTADETENAFIVRAHKAAMDDYPDTDARNSAVYSAWRSSRGLGGLEQKAADKFSGDAFAHARDVPVFSEHSYIDRKGRDQVYDLDALLAVCDRCNYRIADTGNFAALSEGHTPTVEQARAGMKAGPTLGFAGPYRIGMIGNKQPRWAIFQDEHYFRDDVDKVRRLPTRSPEVWLKEKMGDRFMDPIALLGAETPRLDMGIRFARSESGEEVEKYTACMAGANTSFVPELTGGKSKMRYEESEAPGAETKPEQAKMAMQPEDIQEIVDAIMATDVMQFCKALMIAGANKPDQGAAPPAAPGAAAAPVNPMAQPEATAVPGAPAPDAAAPAPGAPSDGAPGASRESPPSEPAESSDSPPPAAGSGEPEPEGDDPDKKKDKYTMALQTVEEKARYAKLEQENAELRRDVDAIKADRRDKERYSQLSELRHTFAFDLDKQVARVKGMSDEQFVEHLADIVENYSRIPIGASLYVPATVDAVPGAKGDPERYSRRAIEITQNERAKGNHGYTYELALATAREEIDGKKAG